MELVIGLLVVAIRIGYLWRNGGRNFCSNIYVELIAIYVEF